MSAGPVGHRGLSANAWMRYISGPYAAHTPQGDAHAIGVLDTRLCRDSGELAILAQIVASGCDGREFGRQILLRLQAETDACAEWQAEVAEEDRLEALADAEYRELRDEQ